MLMNRWIKRAVVAWAAPMVARKAQQMLAQRKAGGGTATGARPVRGVRVPR
jgi:hypothetical protein